MNTWWAKSLKILLILSLVVPILAGCAGGLNVSEQYPLESVSGTDSYVYRAAGQTVPEVAALLAEQRKPDQQSEESPERMFLVYSDQVIHIQQDPEKPEDALIEVSTKEYVRENYSPSFLETYLMASIISDLFDRGRYVGGDYRGYGSQDTYKPKQTYRTATADDKKMAPPMTVNRSGSIFRRSADADATVQRSGSASSTSSSSSSSGKIVRDGSSSSSSSGSSSVFTKPKTTKVPKIKKGIGKIGRRR